MRLSVAFTVVIALAFAFEVIAAEDTSSGENEIRTVTIKLTDEQVEALKNANGKNLTWKLKNTRISGYIIGKAPETVTLNITHVRPGNEVVLEYTLPENEDKSIVFKPAPCPLPIPYPIIGEVGK